MRREAFLEAEFLWIMPLDAALPIFDNRTFKASLASAAFLPDTRTPNFLVSVCSSVLILIFFRRLFLDFRKSLNEALFIGILLRLSF